MSYIALELCLSLLLTAIIRLLRGMNLRVLMKTGVVYPPVLGGTDIRRALLDLI
jgi:hypothetical protein